VRVRAVPGVPCGLPAASGGVMDTIGWFIATTHQLLGHDKAAVVLGVPAGDPADCLICQFEDDPSGERRQAVIDAIGTSRAA
jgi:hypothetical protein